MIMIGAGQKNLSTYLKNSFTARVRAMKFYELKNMHFAHMDTKFQLSSFIRSRDIADLLMYIKTAFFGKKGIFEKNTPKCESAISPLLIKLES